MLTETDVREAATLARVRLVFEECERLRGLDVDLDSEHVHAVNPIRGRLLGFGGAPGAWSVAALFGVGHLRLRQEDHYGEHCVHPANVTRLRALPTPHNLERLLAPVGDP